MAKGLPLSRQPFLRPLFSFLKCCTCGIGTAGCVAGTDGDLLCGAVGVAIVIDAVLDITADSLNVFLRARRDRATAIVFFVVHHEILLYKNSIMMCRRKQIYSLNTGFRSF